MKKSIRVLSLLLAAVMLVQCLPVQTLAASRDHHAPDDAHTEHVTTATQMLEIEPVLPEETAPITEPEPVPAAAQEPALQPMADTSNLSWTLEEGVLTVSGTGAIINFSSYESAPWDEFRDEVTSLIIGEGITKVGTYAFDQFKAMTSLTLPAGLQVIDKYAFYNCINLAQITWSEDLTTIGYETFSRCSSLTSLDLPDSLTTIESYAFLRCTGLQTVRIPDSVTTIESYAFQYCEQLREVDLPASLTQIRPYTFGDCYALERVSIPDSVTIVNNGVFSNCRSLKSVYLPDSVTHLGAYAFYECSALEEARLSPNLTTIGNNTFYNCKALKSIQIPEKVTALGTDAFYGCTTLEEVYVPDSVTVFGTGVFQNCTALRSARLPEALTVINAYLFKGDSALETVNIPATVTAIQKSAFSACSSLEELPLPKGLTTLADNVFQNCHSLRSIDLPEGITSIGVTAFQFCSSLTEIAIPDAVTGIGKYAFGDCTALSTIHLGSGLTTLGEGALSGTPITRITLPEGLTSIGSYAFFACSELESIIVPDSVSTIGNHAFSRCYALKEAVLPSNLKEVSQCMFYEAHSLESIALPDSVTVIRSGAFEDCFALEEIRLSQNLVTIETNAFSDCNALRAFEMPDSVTELKGSIFSRCTALESVILSEGLTELPSGLLSGCTALTQVKLPSRLTDIPQSTFYNCTALKSVEIPETVTSIGESAFRNCSMLESIVIPEAVTSIGYAVFQDCTALKTFSFPESLNTIDSYAFSNCAALEAIEIPDSVDSIGDRAFENCTALAELTLSQQLTVIPTGAFTNCSSLTKVDIPSSVMTVEQYAFDGCNMLQEVYITQSVTDIGYRAFMPTELLTFYTYPSAYAWTYAMNNGIRVVDVLNNVNLTLTVLDAQGAPVTDGVTIEWYATDGDQVLATGSTLRGAKKDAIAYDYRILLDESLSLRYYQPPRVPVVIVDESYDLTWTLSPIGTVTLTGVVTDAQGDPLPHAVLDLTQVYNGAYEKTLSATAGADGSFRIDADAVPTRLRISAEGRYAKTSELDLTGKQGVFALEPTALSALPADKIALRVEMLQAHAPGVTGMCQAVENADALEYTIFNATKNKAVTDFTVQMPWLILGQDQANAGDTLRITAADPAGEMTADSVALTLDADRTGEVTITFLQNGQFRLTEVVGNERNVLMVFDAQGSLVYSCGAQTLYTSRNLPAGDYTLVLLEENGLLRSVASLELLDQLGLTAGADYAVTGVTIRQGLITDVGSVAVPELDTGFLSYIDQGQTLLRLNMQQTCLEQMVTLRLSFAIDERYPSSAETIRIPLSGGLRVRSDVFLDGAAIPYSMEGNTLVIPVHAPRGEIAVYISAYDVGSHYVSATLDFQTVGGHVLQPLGQAHLTTTSGTLNVPTRVSHTRVKVSGKTMPNRLVQVYADGKLVGTTAANAVGTWQLTVPLSKTYRYSFHQIQAKIAAEEEGRWHSSEKRFLTYDSRTVEVSSVTMYNNIHYGLSQVTYFDFINPLPNLFYGVPKDDEILFTFRIRFTGGDVSHLRNVYLVMQDMQGDTNHVRCHYSPTSNTWIAYFTTAEIEDSPTKLGVTYDVFHEPQDPIIQADIVDDITDSIVQVMEQTDEELDSIQYIDDGSDDDLDFYELAELIDKDLDSLEQTLADAQYCYDTAMEDAALTVRQNGSTATTTLGGITTETETIELDEVDENALLAEGYERIKSTDGSCIYQRVSGNTARYVDPVSKRMMIVTYPSGTSSAEPLAGGVPDIFAKTREALEKAYDTVSTLIEAADQLFQTIDATEKQLTKLIRQGEEQQAKIFARSNKMYERMQEYIKSGKSEWELNLIRQEYDRRLDRMSKVHDQVRQNRALLKTVRALSAIAKALPLVSILTSIEQVRDTQQRLENLWNSLPNDCPGDPDGLKAVRNEITALSSFLYGKILLDIIMDVAGIMSIFTAGTIAIPFTGGASLLAAVGIVAAMIAANLATDWMVGEYANIKIDDIKLMIRNLECDVPEDPLDLVPDQWVNAAVIIDPSGYVYEAVPGNRVEGVKAEIYYRDGDQDVLWDAADYDQVNPFYTDAAGYFHWDVPVGQWLVKFSKEGYHDTDSRMDPAANADGYLPVPPPQTQVNTAIVSTAAPEVESVRIYGEEVLLIFSQYMRPETLKGDTVTITCDGAPVTGTIAPSDAQWNYEQTAQYATTFRFVPNRVLTGTASITVDGAVNYAGTPMEAPHSETQTVNLRPTGLFAADTVSMVYENTYQLEVQILPAEAGAGQTVTAVSMSPDLLRVDTPSVTVDENGKATITVYGEMPGSTELELCLEGTDLKRRSCFTIKLESDAQEICGKVTASIPNGAVVAPGTALELFTATAGAQIYYTLDGTCPCVVDSPSRLLYTGPIVLNEDTFLIAYAVKEGAQDSPTSGFLYRICTHPNSTVTGSKAPTCTEAGYSGDCICDDCGTLVLSGQSIPALGHDWDGGTVTVEPTEEHEGTLCYTCVRCGEMRTESIPALDHVHSYEAVVTDPTCTLWGYTTHTCRCGDSYTDSHTEPLGHSPGSWYTVQEPTYLLEGLEERRCIRCAYTEQRPISPRENPFTDVPDGSFYRDPVLWALDHGITNGTSATTFGPGDPCLRAQVVTFLWRAAGSPAPADPNNPFVDIKETDYCYNAVLWAVETGVTNGIDATHFGPYAYCNRAQVVTFLHRSFGSPAVQSAENPFDDVPNGQWFTQSVLWAVERQITNGVSASRFAPSNVCNRAQIVTFLYRAFNG